MEPLPISANDDITLKLNQYSDMVYRICFLYLHNSEDVEDVFQEVFLKLLQNKKPFDSNEHERSWLIRVTINKCKDMLKSFWKKRVVFVEDFEQPYENKSENELLQIISALSPKYKDVIYLFYYEEYTVPEIAKILDQNINTIYSNLHRARMLIKQELEEPERGFSYTVGAESH